MEKIKDIPLQDKIKINSLRCDVCTNFLSISPIFHNDSLGNVCGRKTCNQLATSEGKNYRQRSYEALAEYQCFPCMYSKNGCNELLSWDKVEEHENTCEFESLLCPFSTHRFRPIESEGCSWTGGTSTFLDHLEEEHSEHIFDGHLEFDLENNIKHNELFFSRKRGNIVIISVVFDENKCFYCKIWSGPEIWRNLNYNIQILSRDNRPLIVSKKRDAALIHATISNDEINSSWSKVDLENISQFFGFPKILRIAFYLDGFLMDSPRRVEMNPISTLLDNTICDSCQKEPIQSVSVCLVNSHTICETCLSKSRQPKTVVKGPYTYHLPHPNPNPNPECPLCSTSILFQNLAFENLKSALESSLKKCKLCNQKFDCPSSHMIINHNKSIHNLDKFYSDFDSDNHVYSFDDHIFLLSKTTNGDSIEISVQCLETREIKYKYELKMTNLKNSYFTITVGDFCRPEYLNTLPLKIPLSFLRNGLPYLKNIDFKLSLFRI